MITLNTTDAGIACITRCLDNVAVLVTSPASKTKHLLVEKGLSLAIGHGNNNMLSISRADANCGQRTSGRKSL